MGFKFLKFFLIQLFFIFSGVDAAEKKLVKVAAPIFPGYTNSDGTGVYWDLFRKIFNSNEYKVDVFNYPYARALKMLENKDIDIVLALYHEEIDYAYFPKKKNHFDSDVINIVKLKTNKTVDYRKAGSHSFAWQRTYGYDEYFDYKVAFTETSSIDSALKMLEKGRVDYVIEPKEELFDHLKANKYDISKFEIKQIMELYIYPGFVKNKFGKELKQIYDKRFPAIKKNKHLKKLFYKYNQSFYED